MILYSASKAEFAQDIRSNCIETKLLDAFEHRLRRKTGRSEVASWCNSLIYMNMAIEDSEIPSDATVAVEYKIPQCSRRIDFLIAGKNADNKSSLVIVELKQWTDASVTNKDAIVRTHYGHGQQETEHPSYQAWTYAALLESFSTVVQDENVAISPCAYLHNSRRDEVFRHPFYASHLAKAPLFLRNDAAKLTTFIKEHVKYGDTEGLVYRIDQGKIRPSKNLADSLASMLAGNQEFLMIGEQKLVFETAINLSKEASAAKKHVLIVEGGPGSGKSVVAVNLLVAFTQNQMTSKYVTKNSAPRKVYEELLTGSVKKSIISNLFVNSGAFIDTDRNTFDTLVVDEAHRLNEKSGLYGVDGENQVGEIIRSALFSVFFIDESQKVATSDIGTKEEIRRWAKKERAEVTEMALASQFRCNGSDAYLAWLDHTLGIRVTDNPLLSSPEYDFRVFDDPHELRREIVRLNNIEGRNKSRLVAGYCWPWKSKKDPSVFDIELPSRFKMQWNLNSDGMRWIIADGSVEQCGCIHTCQGLELDYVGVIVGPDLVARNEAIVTDGLKRDSRDRSLKGFRTQLKKSPKAARKEADLIIKNTYRTLMTRGTKGCYIYCTDPETLEYFRKRIVA